MFGKLMRAIDHAVRQFRLIFFNYFPFFFPLLFWRTLSGRSKVPEAGSGVLRQPNHGDQDVVRDGLKAGRRSASRCRARKAIMTPQRPYPGVVDRREEILAALAHVGLAEMGRRHDPSRRRHYVELTRGMIRPLAAWLLAALVVYNSLSADDAQAMGGQTRMKVCTWRGSRRRTRGGSRHPRPPYLQQPNRDHARTSR